MRRKNLDTTTAALAALFIACSIATMAHAIADNLDEKPKTVLDARTRSMLAKQRAKEFIGKQEKALHDKLRSPTNKVDGSTVIGIWAQLPREQLQFDQSAEDAGLAIQTEISAKYHQNATRAIAEFIESRGGKIEYQAQHAPLVIAAVPNKIVPQLERRADVETLYLGREYKPNSDLPPTAVNTPSNDTDAAVPVAGENGHQIVGHPSFADGSYCDPTFAPSNSPTIDTDTDAIANTDAAYLIRTKRAISSDTLRLSDSHIIACTEWAINNGARVLNYNFDFYSSSTMVALDRYVDYVVRHRVVAMAQPTINLVGQCVIAHRNVSSSAKGGPVIEQVVPAKDSELESAVKVNFSLQRGQFPVALSSLRLAIDGTDVTPRARITATNEGPARSGEISFTPHTDMPDGRHTAQVNFTDTRGNSSCYQWTFYVDKR
ncbi:MAG: hypothetical protein HY308_02440 [Gammaproteobacteria bacterium]|nr:hypothetical protein [Gammaproteobacteria bacterium]